MANIFHGLKLTFKCKKKNPDAFVKCIRNVLLDFATLLFCIIYLFCKKFHGKLYTLVDNSYYYTEIFPEE